MEQLKQRWGDDLLGIWKESVSKGERVWRPCLWSAGPALSHCTR